MLVSGKEEPDLEVSPAMNAVLRVFNRIHDTVENAIDTSDETSTAISSIRLLVPSSQAFSLIGKQGSLIKSIQENSGASVRVLPRGMCLKLTLQVEHLTLNFSIMRKRLVYFWLSTSCFLLYEKRFPYCVMSYLTKPCPTPEIKLSCFGVSLRF